MTRGLVLEQLGCGVLAGDAPGVEAEAHGVARDAVVVGVAVDGAGVGAHAVEAGDDLVVVGHDLHVVVDQHAAQERYHYEQLLEKLNQPVIATQPLMVPLVLNVSANVLSLVDSINEKIASFGLSFEVFGNDRLIVREIPLWFQDVHQEDFFYDLVDFFVQNLNVNMESLRKHVIATMACHSSIRFHRKLTRDEMEQVIEDLRKCRQPYHCPHGRPTVITMSDKDLRKEFERG